jgi:hypothetical protein
MLLHSLRALCKAPGGVGSMRKYLEALARATGVSGRFAYSFRTELHFADADLLQKERILIPFLSVAEALDLKPR